MDVSSDNNNNNNNNDNDNDNNNNNNNDSANNNDNNNTADNNNNNNNHRNNNNVAFAVFWMKQVERVSEEYRKKGKKTKKVRESSAPLGRWIALAYIHAEQFDLEQNLC